MVKSKRDSQKTFKIKQNTFKNTPGYKIHLENQDSKGKKVDQIEDDHSWDQIRLSCHCCMVQFSTNRQFELVHSFHPFWVDCIFNRY